jgi:hypothetical protein
MRTTLKAAVPRPRKKHRVFLWIFLAVQVLFVIWLAAGIAGSAGSSIHDSAIAWCHAHPGAYTTFGECVSLYGGGAKAGTAIGIGIIIALWMAADFLLAVPYAIYRLARRPAR